MRKYVISVLSILGMAVLLASCQKGGGGNEAPPVQSTVSTAFQGKLVHEEVVRDVKVTIRMVNIKEALKGMVPEGLKDTHHLKVVFTDAATGALLKEAEVTATVLGPDGTVVEKKLPSMEDHFGADFDLSKKGTYEFLVKFLLKDGKKRSGKFRYEVS